MNCIIFSLLILSGECLKKQTKKMDIGCTSLGGRMTNKDAFRCSGRLGGGGEVPARGGVCPGGVCLGGVSDQGDVCQPPAPREQND